MKLAFDYESKPFGIGQVRVFPWYIPALKLKFGLKALENIKGNVLEIGCGGGAMIGAIKFYRPDLESYGADISKIALSYAKKDFPNVSFLYADIYKLPFTDSSFDAVLTFDIMEHLKDTEKALLEIKRVLKKNGIVHLAIPYEGSLTNIEGWLARFGWKAKEIYCGHIKKLYVGELEKMLEKNGFNKVERKFSTHFLYQIFDALYFSFIQLRGKNFSYQVEGYVSKSRGLRRNLVLLLKNIFAVLTYFESSFFFWLPGLTGHLTYKKE